MAFSSYKGGIFPVATIEGKGRPDMLVPAAEVSASKISDCKVYDRSHLKLLRSPTALA